MARNTKQKIVLQSLILSTIKRALKEDIGSGDITTLAAIPREVKINAEFVVKSDGVIAGLQVAKLVFETVDKNVRCTFLVPDGTPVKKGSRVAAIEGSGRSILTGERVVLNFMQRMSGIATATAVFVEAVTGTKAVILDTRKTMPGLRIFDKWAVRLGGGQNHRFGLFDMVLIKDNHIAAVGSITETVARVRKIDSLNRKMEVEVKNLDELREALVVKPDRILLDNLSVDLMKQAVVITRGKIPLEASGNVNLSTVRDIAQTGVDYISVGALTHSVAVMDISLEVIP